MTALGLFDLQRGYLFPWVAVLYGVGIGTYLALPSEPAAGLWVAVGAVSVGAAGLAVLAGPGPRPLLLVLLIPMIGAGVAALRTDAVAAPKLEFRYYGPIEGRVVAIDRSQSDAVRLTLDRVVLSETSPARTPARVRVSLHGDFGLPRPAPGAIVGLTGHLSPPGGPVEPGGYDFQRHAWFLGLGGVGYTRNPVMTLAPPEDGLSLAVLRLRFRIADRVRAALPGEVGGFAAAITTGDRSSLDQGTLEALRATNLAHLLAISGLHMGLLTGFVFAGLRYGLALSAALTLRWPMKKIAAVGALVAGAVYLALSGNNVATERAFVMVAVMLGAVLIDKRAVTLRAVALAALIVLTLRPETLLGPGFQMSFAATVALVTVYGGLRERDWSQSRWPWGLRIVGGVALSSAVAGLATAPIAAAHFNQIPHYGLLANVLSVPLMGAVIIPGAVIAALLAPFGGEALGLAIMELPIRWILAVAREIATWEGALSHVVAPSAAVLPLVALAGILAALVRGPARLVALPVLLGALGLWSVADRPLVLISESGGQVGVLGETGVRSLSRGRGDGFATRSWLENDGDPVPQLVAAERSGWQVDGNVRLARVGAEIIIHGTGKKGSQEALAYCGKGLVIVNRRVDAPDACRLIDPTALKETGALALMWRDGALTPVPTRQTSGAARPWAQ